MAKAQNIIHLARYRQGSDPAYDAKIRMEAAGEDDVAYDRAVVEIESAPATTLLGARAKLQRLQVWLEHVEDGNIIMPGNWEVIRGLIEGIDKTLEAATTEHA